MICTAIILVIYLLVILAGSEWKREDDTEHFMNRDYTNVLKGLCCVLVVIVHVPAAYGNSLQQMVGGFSQVSVTLYFLFSAYGVLTGIRNKPGYLNSFWKNRLPALLIPFVLSCLIKMIAGVHVGSGGTFFVLVLLLFYGATYVSAKYFPRKTVLLICLFVGAYSILGSATGLLQWPTQALGFAYGALLYEYLPSFKAWIQKSYVPKLAGITFLAGGSTFAYAVMKLPLGKIGAVLLQNTMVFFLILWIFAVTFRLKLGNAASRFLGRISFDIFLYHGLVQGLLLMMAASAVGVYLTSGLFLTLMLILSIGISAVTHGINDRIVALLKNRIE